MKYEEIYHQENNACQIENSKNLTFEEFVELVADMRHNQRRYFAMRKPEILERCKELERDVDRAVARLTDKQLSLF